MGKGAGKSRGIPTSVVVIIWIAAIIFGGAALMDWLSL